MNHVRASIREYVRGLLTSIAGLENSVEIDSNNIPESVEAPLVLVQLGSETIEQLGLGSASGRKNLRELQMFTDIYAAHVVEKLLEAEGYAASVEAKLTADPRMGGLAVNTSLRGYDVETNSEGRKPITRLRLTWSVIYQTYERDATVPA